MDERWVLSCWPHYFYPITCKAHCAISCCIGNPFNWCSCFWRRYWSKKCLPCNNVWRKKRTHWECEAFAWPILSLSWADGRCRSRLTYKSCKLNNDSQHTVWCLWGTHLWSKSRFRLRLNDKTTWQRCSWQCLAEESCPKNSKTWFWTGILRRALCEGSRYRLGRV